MWCTFCALQVYPSITFSLLIWLAAMLNQLWNLNFYVPQSGAVQNIYKSPHVTLIINLNHFARMHNKNELKMAYVYSSESCSFQSSRAWIMYAIYEIIHPAANRERLWWDVKSDWIVVMKNVEYIESEEFELYWDETLCFVLKWKSKCLPAIRILFLSPVLP